MPLFRTTPSTMSGTQVWSEIASNRGTLPCQCPQATECRWHHCQGRPRPHSSKRCSGVGAASALSKVTASGSHSWSSASPSFTSHHPAAGLAHGFPVLYTNTTDLPQCFLLPVGNAPLCGGTRTMLQKGKGPLSVLEVLRELLRPSSSHVRVAPHTHSHISPSR